MAISHPGWRAGGRDFDGTAKAFSGIGLVGHRIDRSGCLSVAAYPASTFLAMLPREIIKTDELPSLFRPPRVLGVAHHPGIQSTMQTVLASRDTFGRHVLSALVATVLGCSGPAIASAVAAPPPSPATPAGESTTELTALLNVRAGEILTHMRVSQAAGTALIREGHGLATRTQFVAGWKERREVFQKLHQDNIDALKRHGETQNLWRAQTNREWKEDDLVFCSDEGTVLDAANVRRQFRAVVARAGLTASDWTPRELRHSFVSLLSDRGVPTEQISLLVGHSGTSVTETVYRKQLRPVVQGGAGTMNRIFPATQTSDRGASTPGS